MIRTQAQLTERQLEALKEIASEQQVSIAELIRRGVETVIAAREQPSWEERKRRAIAVAGSFAGRTPNVSAEHDRYLDEAYSKKLERRRR